jgi:hypothetical protein
LRSPIIFAQRATAAGSPEPPKYAIGKSIG